jgi:hypothetical protein
LAQSCIPFLTIDFSQIQDQKKYFRKLQEVLVILEGLKKDSRSMVDVVGIKELKDLKLLLDEAAAVLSLRRLNSLLMQAT